MEYEKINTLFKRDTQGLIIPTQYTNSEFYYLAELILLASAINSLSE